MGARVAHGFELRDCQGHPGGPGPPQFQLAPEVPLAPEDLSDLPALTAGETTGSKITSAIADAFIRAPPLHRAGLTVASPLWSALRTRSLFETALPYANTLTGGRPPGRKVPDPNWGLDEY